ncbi:hypothetical protein NA56DRAFT_711037 [Hyaloscypha hepaticicola]|uniref:Uncharacterized protein n=1 Tax=Hyaloscypha hepaticicola TaxID=2082293 RepID=A0A2J6PK90_9HELO|nr:hypothetical protein NA56DRAFT_711037 [Hyaloscypha hepaticicola]
MDMVYAFLGLLNKLGLFIPLGYTIQPNYSAPLRDVYISLTRTVIEGSRNLDILAKAVGDEPYLVPMDTRKNISLGAYPTGQLPLRPDPLIARVLLVRGKIVSNVENWINHPFEKHYFMNPDRGWLPVDFQYEKKISTALLADGALLWPFRTVTPEKPSNILDERVKEFLHAYDMWPRIVAKDTTLMDFQKVKGGLKELQQRSLILQRKRLAGCSGDVRICHSSWIKIPVIIEEVGEGADRWKVIGQCYLEGAMYGKLVVCEEEEGDVSTIF